MEMALTDWAKGDRAIGQQGKHGQVTVVESHGVYFLPDGGGGIGTWYKPHELMRATPTSNKIVAPWTAADVDRLNRFQQAGFMHPFTCPGHEGDGNRELVATRRGWICCHCNYTQNWAHAFMLEKPANPFIQLHPDPSATVPDEK